MQIFLEHPDHKCYFPYLQREILRDLVPICFGKLSKVNDRPGTWITDRRTAPDFPLWDKWTWIKVWRRTISGQKWFNLRSLGFCCVCTYDEHRFKALSAQFIVTISGCWTPLRASQISDRTSFPLLTRNECVFIVFVNMENSCVWTLNYCQPFMNISVQI